jgi:cytochrome c-type biogenesis protein
MAEIGILLAFLAGIVSFASPCCLPLVPAYIGYMVGSAPEGAPSRRRIAFQQSLAFVAGFALVFVSLWASIGLIGYVFRDYAGLLRQVGGAVIVFLGLHVAGVINVSALYREVRLPIGPGLSPAMGFGLAPVGPPSYGRSALLGVVLAAGWTPCVGPILGGILGLATVSASVAEGTILLGAYAAGLAVPFVLVAVGATAVSDRVGWIRRHHQAVSVITGAMLVLVGFLMITNTFVRLSTLVPQFGI